MNNIFIEFIEFIQNSFYTTGLKFINIITFIDTLCLKLIQDDINFIIDFVISLIISLIKLIKLPFYLLIDIFNLLIDNKDVLTVLICLSIVKFIIKLIIKYFKTILH